MRKLIVFNNVSIDGRFTDANSDMSWAHAGGDDPEFRAFTEGNAKGGGVMVFGRVTYDLMAGYWPTPLATQQNPELAAQMNELPKVVFSRTMSEAGWANTRLVRGDPAEEVRRLKAEDGPGLVIMGSGTIVAQLSDARLIDEYQVVLCPIALGAGRTMFDGMRSPLSLRLTSTRAFRNGKLFATYAPE